METISRILIFSGNVDFVEVNRLLAFDSATSNVSCYEVDIVNDVIVENEEVFLLQLFSDDSAVLILSPNVSVTIQDNDGMFITPDV